MRDQSGHSDAAAARPRSCHLSVHLCYCFERLQRTPAMSENDNKSIQQRLMELQLQHRDLDDVVLRLSQDPMVDQLQLTRLKKRKLQLKDQIARLKSQLIPDLDA